MKKVEITLYQFKELPEEAKKKAIENYQDINTDYEWHENIFDDWKEKLRKLGYEEPEILYNGFASQGNGACFIAEVILKNWLKKHKLEKKYKKLFREAEDVKITIKHSWRYYYSSSTDVNYEWYGDAERLTEKLEDDILEVVELIKEERETLGDKIYKELEEQYFALTGDEAIADTLEFNEYDFTADGKIYRA
jgi:hypothetical protein